MEFCNCIIFIIQLLFVALNSMLKVYILRFSGGTFFLVHLVLCVDSQTSDSLPPGVDLLRELSPFWGGSGRINNSETVIL